MRRAKIVATLGPATSSYENIRAIIDAGVDVARMNLSHGSYDVHEGVYANVRKAAADAGKPVAVLVDLQGPKIRLGKFEGGPYHLAEGDIFKITIEDIVGNKDISGTTFKGLPNDVKPGDPLLIDDGKVTLRVLETDGTVVTTEVVVPGPVSNNKGINLPGVAVNVPALSDKDEADLRWGLKLGADFIALSFVRNASDIVRVHEIMAEEGRKIPVIAKIEKPQAVDNLEEIIDAFDGIMVARGDLGVELPLEAVPIVQKRAVELCRRMAKPVIVATQMLESMISSPRPTRAETSDVANAVLDGADAVMLSGETSVGEFPVITVETMAKIVESTEIHGLDRIAPLGTKPRTQGGAITLAAAEVADFVEAKFLCVFTESGDSVRRMTRLRSQIPVLGFTPDEAIRRRMSLIWGVESVLVERVTHTDAMFGQVDDEILAKKRANVGDKVVVISGSPPGIAGSTNDMRVHKVGDAHHEAAPAYAKN
ncbi:pyruvate kinase [Leifsonia sp. ALI-44-B]|jgi:pyruvate kinase|uniref:pyruvate kinase n=1 Tax=Leifsonia sp. ALI-44-B TaxID=1933776 RepID=UPI00097C9439|nr:pyruvate kinase [Leifsonia sp. ALI-44-B]ONI63612.1 pyruvate kinase [Leifsonia sp. ALI-44-B]